MTESASGQVDAVVASAEQAPTFIEILIDETGSMGGVKGATITAFNDFIKDQKQAEAACQVTMTKFSTTRVITPYEMIDLSMVPDLTPATFNPGGGTNLYDTIVMRCRDLSEKVGSLPCNVLFLVITDGEDTSSRHSPATVRETLCEKMSAGWTFVYLGAYESALKVALSMGFPENNIKAFSATDAEVSKALHQTSAATTAYRSARASGAISVGTSSMGYFTGGEE